MVTSIKVKGKYNIGINSSNQINVDGTNVALKEIPFVRYDFESYGIDEVNYIKAMMQKFSLSTHLVQIKVNENIEQSLINLGTIASKFAKYLYINVTQSVLDAGHIDNETLRLTINAITTNTIDRIMLIDNTDNMDMLNAKKLIAETAKTIGVATDMIGICSSPLCMTGELACLSALKARELATKYSDNDEVALPSANHQCMNCCGCIRFFEVTEDIAAPAETKKAKSSGSAKSASSNKEKAPKKAKAPKTYGLGIYV